MVDIEPMDGAVALDVFFLLAVLAIMVGAVPVARRLSAWRSERRIGGKRGKGESERIDHLRKLAKLRDEGSLSEEDFEEAQARVRRE